MERRFLALAVILTAGSFSKGNKLLRFVQYQEFVMQQFDPFCMLGQIFFILQPKNVTVNENTDAFFPCTYFGTAEVPAWRINNHVYITSGLPPKYSYNGTGLIAHNVDLSLNRSSHSCLFAVYAGQGHFMDIESNIGFLNIQGLFAL